MRRWKSFSIEALILRVLSKESAVIENSLQKLLSPVEKSLHQSNQCALALRSYYP